MKATVASMPTAMPATTLPGSAVVSAATVLSKCRSASNGECKCRDYCQQDAFHDHLLDDVILDLTREAKFG
jgi:hypothetical protein